MFPPKKFLFTWLLVSLLYPNLATAQDKIAIGETRIVHSKILKEDRGIQIYLPPSYANSKIQKADYPVIYLLDSETHFHYLTGFIEKLSQGPYAYIPEMIVVGIVNTNRTRDLTPTASMHKHTKQLDTENSGGNEAFIAFIEKELFPWVDQNYRTENYKLLIGHSFGGITALNILLNYPKMFHAYIVHDPSLWYDNQVILNRFTQSIHTDFSHRKLYLTQAGASFNNAELNAHFSANRQFQALLQNNRFPELKWQLQQYEKEDHGSLPIVGNADGLKYIFKEHQINIKAIAAQTDLIENSYRKLSDDLNYKFLPTETYIERVARYFMRSGTMDQALIYLQQNVSRFPQSPQAHYTLYEYYTQTGNNEQATHYLNKAITLGYPSN